MAGLWKVVETETRFQPAETRLAGFQKSGVAATGFRPRSRLVCQSDLETRIVGLQKAGVIATGFRPGHVRMDRLQYVPG